MHSRTITEQSIIVIPDRHYRSLVFRIPF